MSIRRFRRAFAIGMTLLGVALLGAGPVAASGVGSSAGAPSDSGSGSGTGSGSGAGSGPTIGSTGGASSAPTAITLCHGGYGTYLGLGTRRPGAGRNLLVVEVCGDPAKHTISMVRDSYIKVDGPRAGSLRFHWRWADKAGIVRGGGDDDNGAFALDPQSENAFAWVYSEPAKPMAPGARCVVGVLSEGMAQFVTEPVCL